MPKIPAGMTVAEFCSAFAEGSKGSMVHVLTARNPKAPEVGIVASLKSADDYLLTPRAIWFPWASSRNRLECAVKWLNEARKVTMPLFTVDQSLQRFFRHMARYGVVREVGKVNHVPKPGAESWTYQGVRMGDG